MNRLVIIVGLGVLGLVGCTDDDDASSPPDAALPDASAPRTLDLEGLPGRVDFPYTLDVASEDPTGEARTYELAQGALPPGLSLDATGTVDGTPTAWGRYEAVLWGDSGCGEPACRLVVRLGIEVAPVILLSGFGPFGNVTVNPSWEAVAPLHRELIDGYDLRVVEVPVVWETGPERFFAEFDRLQPALAVASGVDMGESVIRLESLAQNDAYGEDEAGVFLDEVIDPQGAALLESSLPLADLQDALEQASFSVGISDNAGTYLCNYLFYLLMRRLETDPPTPQSLGGFIHVPDPLDLPAAEMTDAWRVLLTSLVAFHRQLIRRKRRRGDRPCRATIHHPPHPGGD